MKLHVRLIKRASLLSESTQYTTSTQSEKTGAARAQDYCRWGSVDMDSKTGSLTARGKGKAPGPPPPPWVAEALLENGTLVPAR